MTFRWLTGTALVACMSISVAAQSVPSGQVPTETTTLGSVTLPRSVRANGEVLRAGTYTLRLTADTALPSVPGIQMERWVEFLRAGKAVGREVVSIVPQAEVRDLNSGAKGVRPGAGESRVEMLKGNDYLRVWINRRGVNYLIHLPPVTTS